MAYDGIFIHYLLEEMTPDLVNVKINRINRIDDGQFVFILSNRKKLFMDVSPNFPHMAFTDINYTVADKTTPFATKLKKIFEGAIITQVSQKDVDRVVTISVNSFDELHYIHPYALILEFFGRNTNALIIDKDKKIIDCMYKTELDSDVKRSLAIGLTYTAFPSTGVNPLLETAYNPETTYMGCGREIQQAMAYSNKFVFDNKITPTFIKKGQKVIFYCFDFITMEGDKVYYPSLSSLLDAVVQSKGLKETMSKEQKLIATYITRETARLEKKKAKQEAEYQDAIKDRGLQGDGLYLLEHLSDVHKGDRFIEGYALDGTFHHVILDPLCEPTRNLERIFNKYKKAKRAEEWLIKDLEATQSELDYVSTLKEQLAISNRKDVLEIIDELNLNKNKVSNKKKRKPEITTYKIDGVYILVGKNNYQNNYLTKEIAHKDDYFFHVKGIPGSHTILRCNHPTPQLIQTAADIASFYSSSKALEKVPVDYVEVKYVKRVPGTKGSFVTFTHEQTVDGHPNAVKDLKQVDSYGQ